MHGAREYNLWRRRSHIMQQVDRVETRYSYLNTSLSSMYSYIDGVELFKEMGHIYPYETLDDDEVVAYKRQSRRLRSKSSIWMGTIQMCPTSSW